MRRAGCVVLLLTVVGGGEADGQDRASAALLPFDHWSRGAAHRLAALGLAPAGFAGERGSISQVQMWAVLTHADSVAESDAMADVVDAYRARFEREFLDGGPVDALDRFEGSRFAAGYESLTGRTYTGSGYESGHPSGAIWNEPEPRPNSVGAAGHGRIQVAMGSRVAAIADYHAGPADDGFRDLYGSFHWRNVIVWGGRHTLGFGPPSGSAVVIREIRMDGAGVQSVAPFRLPWIGRYLGPVEAEIVAAREDWPNSFQNAWIFVGRGSIAPHSRIALTATRGVFFGGEGNTELDWFAILSTIIGKHAGEGTELDNQVVSFGVSYRPPTEEWLPLKFALEWGFEDSAGAWRDVPGIVMRVDAPAIRGLPWLALALERTHIATRCCGNPIWYRHVHFRDGWTQEGRPLGHPLGGEGDEWAASAAADLLDARLRLAVRGFQRRRGEGNLYSPDRRGHSRGATLEAGFLISPGLEAVLTSGLENGEDWRERSLRAGLVAIF